MLCSFRNAFIEELYTSPDFPRGLPGNGMGGALFVLLDFFFLSSVLVSVSTNSRIASLSPLNELVALRFFRGGLEGPDLDRCDKDFFTLGGAGNEPSVMLRLLLVVAELLAMLMQLIPLRFLGRFVRFAGAPLLMCAIRL